MSFLENVKQELQKSVDSLKTMKDELALKAHLGSMEAKNSLEQVQQSVDQIQQQTEHMLYKVNQGIEQGTDEAQLRASLANMELRDAWGQFAQRLEHFEQAVQKHETNLKGKWDMLQLKAKLAQMEWRQQFDELQSSTSQTFQSFTQNMSSSIKDFGDQVAKIFGNK